MTETKTSMTEFPLTREQKECLAKVKYFCDKPDRLNYFLTITFVSPYQTEESIEELMQDLLRAMCETFVAKRRYSFKANLCPVIATVVETKTKAGNAAIPHVHCVLSIHRETLIKFLPFLRENSFKKIGRFPKLHPNTIKTSHIVDMYDLDNLIKYITKNSKNSASAFCVIHAIADANDKDDKD